MSASLLMFLALKTGVACPDAFYSTALHAREGFLHGVLNVANYKAQLYRMGEISCRTSNPDALWQMVYTESNFSFELVNLHYNGMKLSGEKATAFAKTMGRNKETANSLNVEIGPLQINWRKMGRLAAGFDPIDFIDALKSVRFLASPHVKDKMKTCGESDWLRCYYKVVRPDASRLFALQIDSAGQKLTETVKKLIATKNISRELVGDGGGAKVVSLLAANILPNAPDGESGAAARLNAETPEDASELANTETPEVAQEAVQAKTIVIETNVAVSAPTVLQRPQNDLTGYNVGVEDLAGVNNLADFQARMSKEPDGVETIAGGSLVKPRAAIKSVVNKESRRTVKPTAVQLSAVKPVVVQPNVSTMIEAAANRPADELLDLGEKIVVTGTPLLNSTPTVTPELMRKEESQHSQSIASIVNESSEYPVFYKDPVTPFGGSSLTNPLLRFLKPAMQSRETNRRTGEKLPQGPEFKQQATKAIRDLKELPTAKCLFCLNDDCTETKPGKPAVTSGGDRICMEPEAPLSILQGFKNKIMGTKE